MPNIEPQGHRIGFPLTDEMTRQTIDMIEKVGREPGEPAHISDLVDLVLELTNTGLYEYYIRPLEQAKVGVVALSTAKIGVTTAKRGIAVIVGRVIRSMSPDQLSSIADSLESMLIRPSSS